MADIFTLFGRIAINADEAKRQIDDVSGQAGHLKNRFESVGNSAMQLGRKIKNALVAAGITKAVSSLVKASVSGYAEYEQLVGGVETLFGASGQSLEEYAESVGKSVDEVEGKYNQLMNAQSTVFANARAAYKNTGYSANQYMQMATLFSASLISNLKGDTEKAAGYTDLAISDMADNVSKMGTNVEDVQNAYKGFAKGTYDMLDNLRIGYSGGKTEMQRLLKDAQKLSGKKYNIKNLTDIIEAIHVIQEEMGIAGNAEAEAATTISGSINATKAAWENLVMGLADGNADIDKLFGNLTASAKNVVTNIGKVVPSLLKNMGTLIRNAGQTLANEWETRIYPWLQDAFKVALGIDLPDWDLIKTTVSDKVEEIKTAAMDKLSGFKNFLGELGLTNDLQTAFENVKSFASDIGSVLLSIGQWATGEGKGVVELLGGVALGITALLNPLQLVAAAILLIATNWESVKAAVKSAFDATADWLANNLGGAAESFRENVIVPIIDGWNSVKSAISAAADALLDFFGISGEGSATHTGESGESHGGLESSKFHFASGLRRVPYDGLNARLHKNEAVLTASQAAIWRGERMPALAGADAIPVQTEQPINMTINISGSTGSPYEVAQAVRNAVDDWRWRG